MAMILIHLLMAAMETVAIMEETPAEVTAIILQEEVNLRKCSNSSSQEKVRQQLIKLKALLEKTK